jgi:hypothetical protein
MAEKPAGNQSGGVNIHGGTVNTGGGPIVGRDVIVNQGSARELQEALRPIADVISSAPTEKRVEALALAKLEEIKQEAAKGPQRNDSVLAKLVDGLVGLVPAAASAVVSAFGTPILGAVAGPVTKFALAKIKGE